MHKNIEKKEQGNTYEQVRLAEIQELRILAIEEYKEYINLIKNTELQQTKLQLNWSKFHLFYEQNKFDTFGSFVQGDCRKNRENNLEWVEKKKKKKKKKNYSNYKSIEDDLKIIKQKEKQNDCYYFKAHHNNNNNKQFILHILKEIPNAVELYINIKIETINKIKNRILTDMNHFCKTRLNKIIFLILLSEIKLNNLQIRQKDVNHEENNLNISLTKNIILFCQKLVEEITKNLIPFFFSFNIFSSPDYFNYHFEHFHQLVENIGHIS
ncbi:hypothetical protein, conserved [Plasmodium gonderi]|uniref:Uncharacterized protein n=1 Tax=Plasmodium gonderi TaxID=77519 RepID=A0A1Y1J988_PLAGO|nr:hypothetical protein, conserved [Plasmodium gonderi]GAW79066.1 hypothetical protein, conserved [Plasmodium gonderi]